MKKDDSDSSPQPNPATQLETPQAEATEPEAQSKAYQYHQNLAEDLDEEFDYAELGRLHQHSPFASFRWAFRGLYYAYRTQRNFRIELLFAAFAVILGFVLRISAGQWTILLFSISQVLGAELSNTALEYMVDLYEKKFNRLAMMAKDIAASFVLLSAMHAFVQGVLIFGPHIWALLLGLWQGLG